MRKEKPEKIKCIFSDCDADATETTDFLREEMRDASVSWICDNGHFWGRTT